MPTQSQTPLARLVVCANQVTPTRARCGHTGLIYGDLEATFALLGQSTAYVERTHLTMRTFNSWLARKTLSFSKSLTMYRVTPAWDDCCYDFIRVYKSLRLEVVDDQL